LGLWKAFDNTGLLTPEGGDDDDDTAASVEKTVEGEQQHILHIYV